MPAQLDIIVLGEVMKKSSVLQANTRMRQLKPPASSVWKVLFLIPSDMVAGEVDSLHNFDSVE